MIQKKKHLLDTLRRNLNECNNPRKYIKKLEKHIRSQPQVEAVIQRLNRRATHRLSAKVHVMVKPVRMHEQITEVRGESQDNGSRMDAIIVKRRNVCEQIPEIRGTTLDIGLDGMWVLLDSSVQVDTTVSIKMQTHETVIHLEEAIVIRVHEYDLPEIIHGKGYNFGCALQFVYLSEESIWALIKLLKKFD